MTQPKVWAGLAPRVRAASSAVREKPASHGLHGADDEGEADEEQGRADAARAVGEADAQRFERRAEQALGGEEGGERDAGDGGGECEGQVDGGIEQAAAGQAVPGEHPGEQDADGQVEQGGDGGPAEAGAEGGDGAGRQQPGPGCGGGGGGHGEHGGERQGHDDAEPQERGRERAPITGQAALGRGEERHHRAD